MAGSVGGWLYGNCAYITKSARLSYASLFELSLENNEKVGDYKAPYVWFAKAPNLLKLKSFTL